MVRNYRTDAVEQETVRRIVRVVQRAPSAEFSQGHRVVVVTDAAVRKGIANVAEGWYLERGDHPWTSTAPVHLVLGIREASYHERYQESDKVDSEGSEIPWPVPFWVRCRRAVHAAPACGDQRGVGDRLLQSGRSG